MKNNYSQITQCRVCGNRYLEPILDLGTQMLTGVFPRHKTDDVTKGPLRLVKCVGDSSTCGLLQLEHSYELGEMYGENYGYRSGLNSSMVKHLRAKVERIMNTVALAEGDLVVDIGSNDSTTLQAYSLQGLILVGIDPTGRKFQSFYPPHISLIPDFFSASLMKSAFPAKKAKVVTSFSMFYDLERPMDFMRDVFEILDSDGIWVFEQSYMPTMLRKTSYDTVCHEHLEYYSLRQIKWMADRTGFRIVDVEFNDINGGSISIAVSKDQTKSESRLVQQILQEERATGLDTLEPYKKFAEQVRHARSDFVDFLISAKEARKRVVALGASTKGNVILQYSGVNDSVLAYVGEVNHEKIGCFTPGTWIPIVSEEEALASDPDYVVILPWHFEDFFVSQDKFKKHSLVFPLPRLHVINARG